MSNYRKRKLTAVPTPESPAPVSQPSSIPARGMRVAEAAQYIGSTICFVRSLIATRELKALMLGKRWVLLREDLDSYLDMQRRRVSR